VVKAIFPPPISFPSSYHVWQRHMKQKKAARSLRTPSSNAGIKEVASHAGVGIGSVSRVLNGSVGVSEEMRRRVLDSAERLNYSPNILAQSLRSRATKTVGFIVADISNPLLSSIVRGAEEVLSTAGYSILLTNSGGQPATDAERVRLLQQRQVDGFIILPTMENSRDFHAALCRLSVPAVIIDRTLPPSVPACYVLSDHYVGVMAAAKQLLDLGHRRIGVIVGQDVRPTRERLRAVKDAYAAGRIKPQFVVDKGPLSVQHGQDALRRFLDSPQPTTAVLLGGNQLLEGALEVVRARDLRLGRDLSLVSCDDLPLGRLFETPISIVRRDTGLIGQSAARMLLAAIATPTLYRQNKLGPEILPTWYEARKSCGRLQR
jgi:LacI family transcriptional regulator